MDIDTSLPTKFCYASSALPLWLLAKCTNQASNVPALFLVDRSVAREPCSPHAARFAGGGDPVGKHPISESGTSDQMTYHLSRLNGIFFDYCRAAYSAAARSGVLDRAQKTSGRSALPYASNT